MQIFEITQRKRTDEGALGALGSFAKGVGKSLANKFVSSTLPGVTAFDDADEPAKAAAPATAQATAPATAQATAPATAQATAPATAQATAPAQATTVQPKNTVGFNADNVVKLTGMQKYAKPAAPAAATQPTNRLQNQHLHNFS